MQNFIKKINEFKEQHQVATVIFLLVSWTLFTIFVLPPLWSISWFLLTSIYFLFLGLYAFRSFLGDQIGKIDEEKLKENIKNNKEIEMQLYCLEELTEFDKNNELEKSKEKNRWALFGLFFLLIISSFFTIKNYMYPTGYNYFSNAKINNLELLGFKFKDSVFVASSVNSDNSLWDNLNGDIIVSKNATDSLATLKFKNLYEPLFVRKNANAPYILKNAPTYLDTLDVSHGFTLKKNDDAIFTLNITEVKRLMKNDITYIIETQSKKDTSTFGRKIKMGYPLISILLRATKLNLADEHKNALKDVYLLPDKYGKDIKEFKLLFFPKDQEAVRDYSIAVQKNTINLSEIEYPEDSLDIPTETDFFIGTANKFYSGFEVHFDSAKSNDIFLKYKTSIKYALPDPKPDSKGNYSIVNSQYFLTSSVEKARMQSTDKGYLLDILHNQNNKNHINALIRFEISGADTAINLEINDFGISNKFGKNKERISSNKEFPIYAKGSDNNLNWIFSIKDRRDSNDANKLTLKCIAIFLSILLLIFAIRIFLMRKIKFFPLEFAVFIFVLACLTIRFILLWRMATFIPLEANFSTLQILSRSYQWEMFYFFYGILGVLTVYCCIYYIMPVFIKEKLKSIVVYISEQLRNIIKWLRNIIKTKKKLRKVLLCIKKLIRFIPISILIFSILLIIEGLSFFFYPKLERFSFICFPILTWIAFDAFYLLKIKEGAKSFRFRIFIYLCTLGYCSKCDAGFGIIFLYFGLAYYGIYLIVWGIKGTSSRFSLLYRIIGGFLLILFVSFTIFEKYLILLILDNAKILSFILLLFAMLYWVWNFYILEKRMCFVFVVILFSVISAIGILSLDIEKMEENYLHLKYRVKMMDEKNEVGDLIRENIDKENNIFHSKNIEKILNTAHNQWFINLYLNIREKNNVKEHFYIAPHFAGGSSYTTQISDLVITRYVIAEHPSSVMVFLLFVFLAMIFVAYSGVLSSRIYFPIFGAFLLIFCISFLVFFSATNRIVFIGQDFPFISLNSKLAWIMPLALCIFAVFWQIICVNITKKNYIKKIKNNIKDCHKRNETPIIENILKQYEKEKDKIDIGLYYKIYEIFAKKIKD